MLFSFYADKYGLTIIKPKYVVDESDKSWTEK